MSLAGVSCIGYCRVSTEQQAGEQQTSLADQARAIDALAVKLGTSVGRWYRDEGASGATVEQRPALSALLADCAASPRKPSRPGFVLVLNDSRWGRFPDSEESAYWRTHLRRVGWLVRFVEHDDTQDPAVRGVMRAIVASQATQKRADVVANAKRGSRGTAALGFWATRSPYGYHRKVVYPPGRERTLRTHERKAIDEKVTLTPDPEAAAIVRTLFLRYATGTDTLATLTDWLTLDVPGRKWTRAAVRFTLANPVYVGDVVSGRTVAGDRTRDAAPEPDWIVRRDAHPGLVSRTLFSAVQDVLARNQKWTNRVRTDWLVSGLVQCPCGKPLVAGGGSSLRRPGRPSVAYRCVTRGGPKAGRCPFPGAIKKEWLEGAVIAEVGKVVGAPAHRKRLAAHLDRALAQMRAQPETNAAALEREIADGIRSRDRLVEAIASGLLAGEEARTQLDAVRRLLGRLEARRDALRQDVTSERALDETRNRMLALTLDFRSAAKTLQGPALRELLRPWIARGVFDPRDRTLTLDIRHLPVHTHGDLTQMPWPSDQTHGSTGSKVSHTTRRRVVVGAPQ